MKKIAPLLLIALVFSFGCKKDDNLSSAHLKNIIKYTVDGQQNEVDSIIFYNQGAVDGFNFPEFNCMSIMFPQPIQTGIFDTLDYGYYGPFYLYYDYNKYSCENVHYTITAWDSATCTITGYFSFTGIEGAEPSIKRIKVTSGFFHLKLPKP